MKKQGIKRYIPWIIVGVLALLLALMPTIARKAASSAEASVLETAAAAV